MFWKKLVYLPVKDNHYLTFHYYSIFIFFFLTIIFNIVAIMLYVHYYENRLPFSFRLSPKFSLFSLIMKIIFFSFIYFYWICWGDIVNKITQVSGVQCYTTSSVYCTVCSPPLVKSPSITIYHPLLYLLQLPSTSFPLAITILLSVSMGFFFLLTTFTLLTQPPSPSISSDSC